MVGGVIGIVGGFIERERALRCDIEHAGESTFASQRAMIAERLRPFYDAQAKKRQIRKPTDSVQQQIADQNSQARSEAGRAAGVNHELR